MRRILLCFDRRLPVRNFEGCLSSIVLIASSIATVKKPVSDMHVHRQYNNQSEEQRHSQELDREFEEGEELNCSLVPLTMQAQAATNNVSIKTCRCKYLFLGDAVDYGNPSEERIR